MPDDPFVILERGALQVPHEICGRYFAGLETVILLRRDVGLLILPVMHAAAGGYLLKMRNTNGDRVIHAADFFRDQGFADIDRHVFAVHWRSDLAGLALVAKTDN